MHFKVTPASPQAFGVAQTFDHRQLAPVSRSPSPQAGPSSTSSRRSSSSSSDSSGELYRHPSSPVRRDAGPFGLFHLARRSLIWTGQNGMHVPSVDSDDYHESDSGKEYEQMQEHARGRGVKRASATRRLESRGRTAPPITWNEKQAYWGPGRPQWKKHSVWEDFEGVTPGGLLATPYHGIKHGERIKVLPIPIPPVRLNGVHVDRKLRLTKASADLTALTPAERALSDESDADTDMSSWGSRCCDSWCSQNSARRREAWYEVGVDRSSGSAAVSPTWAHDGGHMSENESVSQTRVSSV